MEWSVGFVKWGLNSLLPQYTCTIHPRSTKPLMKGAFLHHHNDSEAGKGGILRWSWLIRRAERWAASHWMGAKPTRKFEDYALWCCGQLLILNRPERWHLWEHRTARWSLQFQHFIFQKWNQKKTELDITCRYFCRQIWRIALSGSANRRIRLSAFCYKSPF